MDGVKSYTLEFPPNTPEIIMGPIQTNGGPSLYYDFPEGAITLNDLIEHKDMGFHRGNIFKACWRMGTKEGTSEEYDMRKIIYSALRMLKKDQGVDEVKRYLKELMDDPQFKG